jgi:hypothetical protein
MSTNPDIARPAREPVDLTAILSHLQDQIDDLTDSVQAQQQRIDRLAQQLRHRPRPGWTL